MYMKMFLYLLIIASVTILLSSCAVAPVKPPSYTVTQICPQVPGPVVRQDLYHVVAPGETFWRIGKMYDVRMEDIMRANHLSRPQELKMGQRLLIPRAAPIRAVISLCPSDKWKYIIIHHSATEEGNAYDFHKLHRRKGWNLIGYDFVIDNGTGGKIDGQIEASPRWIKQIDGAHCRASNMNSKGIGVCLVGNFSKDKVSARQMDSLVHLVDTLRKYYKIPKDHIMGHGQVPGARTECPGKYFPWKEFYDELH